MERDLRRGQGEQRGCHNFDKTISDEDLTTNSGRRGGLNMSQRYYYYEVDGSAQTYIPSLPTTTTCSLTGQTGNTLDVPVERRTRLKSASMNSLRTADYKMTDPVDKFTASRLASVASNRREFRIPSASASSILPKRATRSVSPAPNWTGTARRFLGFKLHNRDQESDRGRKSALSQMEDVFVEEEESTEPRAVTPSGSIRSRDMSPESLRRFLSDDLPSSSSSAESAPGFSIPADIEEETEDNDDDDNFATTTVCIAPETAHLTNLSPPPFLRGGLSAPPASHSIGATIPAPMTTVENAELGSAVEKKRSARPAKLDIPRSHSAASMASSSMTSAASPRSTISKGLSQFSFFDDSDDEEPTLLGNLKQDRIVHTELELRAPITSYSLPRTCSDGRKHLNANVLQSFESPAVLARSDNGVPVDSSAFFGLPNVDISLQDLVGDSTWMNDVIREKDI
ncbi:hypothetical protein F4859DRAFT_514097 [Xylaria cf. heliscus]|nr:hypothetical protein F4859DRAFT_514097 [Xylaria cf. heliscus]